MQAAEIADALEGRKEGRTYRCRCPVHGGRSLFVRDADRDNPLIVCHGGCAFGDVASALQSMGLWTVTRRDREQAQERKTQRKLAWAKRFYWWWRELEGTGWQPTGQDWEDFRKAERVLAKHGGKPPSDKPLFDNSECWT